ANTAGTSSVNIDDSGDGSSKSATLDTFVDLTTLQVFGRLTNLGNAGAITWDINDADGNNDIGLVTIHGDSAGNTFKVNETDTPGANSSSLAVVLNSGTGSDTVNVLATDAPLTIQGQDGADTVNVGSLAPAMSGGT